MHLHGKMSEMEMHQIAGEIMREGSKELSGNMKREDSTKGVRIEKITSSGS